MLELKATVQEGRSQAVSVIEALFGAEFFCLKSGFTRSSPNTFSVLLEMGRDGCSPGPRSVLRALDIKEEADDTLPVSLPSPLPTSHSGRDPVFSLKTARHFS